MLFFYYYSPFNVDFVQTLWDYAIDPVILATFILIVVVNVRASMKPHNEGMGVQRLPMDVFTMAAGFTGALYMHNYVLKFAGAFEPSAVLWDVLCPYPASYWRQAKRAADRHHARIRHQLLAAGKDARRDRERLPAAE